MLKGISPVISPDLLKTLAEMGHGDEIVFADAHFPGHSLHTRVVRADGVTVSDLLVGAMPLFELDSYDDPLIMMQAVAGDMLDPSVQDEYMDIIRRHEPLATNPLRLERTAFYVRASKAFAVVMTGELRRYGNIILKKGVTP